MYYFARVTAGLEQIAWQDIQQRTGATLQEIGHRRIDFTYDGRLADLLMLRSVDDVYLAVTQLYGLDRTRPSLATFQQLEDVDFTSVLDAIATSRRLPRSLSYSVTASYLGKRNYSRYDIEAAVQDAIATRYDWEFIPNRPEADEFHDIDLRVLVEEDWALVGIRLGTVPLHRRPYKIASLPGSLKAPVAYCLCLLADLKPTDNLLDPTCGAGTILIEASTLVTRGSLAGIDLDASAITAARQNGEAAGLPIITDDSAANTEPAANTLHLSLHHGDLQHAQMQPASFQAVVANPPWGNQVPPQTDLLSLYASLVNLIDHVLTADGRVVIITDQISAFQTALYQHPQLALISTTSISLFGSHPTIYLIQKK